MFAGYHFPYKINEVVFKWIGYLSSSLSSIEIQTDHFLTKASFVLLFCNKKNKQRKMRFLQIYHCFMVCKNNIIFIIRIITCKQKDATLEQYFMKRLSVRKLFLTNTCSDLAAPLASWNTNTAATWCQDIRKKTCVTWTRLWEKLYI